MHQTKKGIQWHFGMKAHIGVDAESGLVHSVVGTAANVNDVTLAHKFLHGQETNVLADAGYERRLRQAIRRTGRLERPQCGGALDWWSQPPADVRGRLAQAGQDWGRSFAVGRPNVGGIGHLSFADRCREWPLQLVQCVIEKAPHLWSDAVHGKDESDADRERATAVGCA